MDLVEIGKKYGFIAHPGGGQITHTPMFAKLRKKPTVYGPKFSGAGRGGSVPGWQADQQIRALKESRRGRGVATAAEQDYRAANSALPEWLRR